MGQEEIFIKLLQRVSDENQIEKMNPIFNLEEKINWY